MQLWGAELLLGALLYPLHLQHPALMHGDTCQHRLSSSSPPPVPSSLHTLPCSSTIYHSIRLHTNTCWSTQQPSRQQACSSMGPPQSPAPPSPTQAQHTYSATSPEHIHKHTSTPPSKNCLSMSFLPALTTSPPCCPSKCNCLHQDPCSDLDKLLVLQLLRLLLHYNSSKLKDSKFTQPKCSSSEESSRIATDPLKEPVFE